MTPPPVGLEPTTNRVAVPKISITFIDVYEILTAASSYCSFHLAQRAVANEPVNSLRLLTTKKEKARTAYELSFGSPSWTRTNDPAVNSRMLYRLSYRGMSLKCFNIIADKICNVNTFF